MIQRFFWIVVLLFIGQLCNGAEQPNAVAIHELLQDFSRAGVAVGATAPEIKLKDQSGRMRDVRSLTGPKGLVLVFFRSADW